MEIKVGDTVCLRSNRDRQMSVTQVVAGDDKQIVVNVMWITVSDEIRQAKSIPAECLAIIQSAE